MKTRFIPTRLKPINLGRILIFTATYNEADNISSLLNKIWDQLPDADILVVDDQSPDSTGQRLDAISSNNHKLKVIHRPKKLGLGTAHLLAIFFAIQQGYDALVTMDADHSHNPTDIPLLLEKLSNSDFVIGSRYVAEGGCNYTGYRRFLSLSANVAARWLLGIRLHEFTTSFRAFRVNELTKLNFFTLHNEGYSFFMESLYRFNQARLRLTEVPIQFHPRHKGKSKIPRFEIIRGIPHSCIVNATFC